MSLKIVASDARQANSNAVNHSRSSLAHNNQLAFRSQSLISPTTKPLNQPKLKIGVPNDKYEQEADRVADQVMRMPEPRLSPSANEPTSTSNNNSGNGVIQRTCASCSKKYQAAEKEDRPVISGNLCPKCRVQTKALAETISPLVQRLELGEEEKGETIQAKSAGQTPEMSPTMESGIQSLKGGGQSLSQTSRSFFEPRIGHDFSQVRIHSGNRATDLARSINAKAFTVGRDVVFGAGQYQPHSDAGKHLMAHELTHVIQQARTGPRVAREEADSFAPFESEGSRMAREFSRLTISIVEDALLATLRRDGANAFLRQLQRQSATDKRLLGQRASFLTAVRAALRGYDLWNAETMLGVDVEHKQSLDRSAAWVNPFLTPAEQQAEARATRRAEDFRRLTLFVIRDALLEALRRYDSIAFLRELRAVSRQDRRLLETDSTFLAEMRRYFRGTSLWIVRRLLRFGPRFADLPVPVRELGWAVRDRDTTRVRDLLRAYPELRSERRTPGVRELLEYEFRRSPDLAEIRRVFTEGESHRGNVSRLTRSAHYDRPRGGGALQVRRYGATRQFTVARTTSEVRVIVRIRFVHTTVSGTTATPTNRTYHISDAIRNDWRRQIEAAWNGRFRAVSGATRLPIVFVPVFTESNPHYTVGIVDSEGYFREDMTTWWLHSRSSHKQAAHEFGHMLGAADEYGLPGTTAEVPVALGLSAAERQRSSVEGVTGTARSARVGGYNLPGIMGSQDDESAAGLPRHLWLVIDQINRQVRRTGEAPFRLTRS